MELRQLRYVLAIAAAGGFTRAAEEVHVSQPSLSQQVRQLEQELGVKLFSRGANGTVLTPAGEIVVRRAKEVEQKLEEMAQELADLADLQSGHLTIGSLPITGGHVLPPALSVFRREHPGVRLQLVEERTPDLIAVTLSGQTDFSILTLPLAETGLAWEALLTEELLLAVPAGHPLSDRRQLALQDVAHEPFVLLKQGNGFRTVCDLTCRQAGFTPNVAFESDNIETAKALVAAGLGVTLVPEMIAGGLHAATAAGAAGRDHAAMPALVYIRLTPAPTRTVVAAWRRDRYLSRAAQAFLQVLRESVRNKQPKVHE